MIQIDLITGFLGAGKTTFIKRYVRHLCARGLKVGIIENDFGAINVDMMLLQESEGDLCEIEMVVGGGDLETHKRRYRTKLISMAMRGFDRVIIEPSGVYDVDEFFDVLYEDPVAGWYEVGTVIAIVDAKLPPDLSDDADYLLMSQIADAGAVVLSHAQEATDEDITATLNHINASLEKFKCKRVIMDKDVIRKDWNELTSGDMDDLMKRGYLASDYLKRPVMERNAFASLYYMNTRLSKDEALERAQAVLKDETCGHVMRVKGFVEEDGVWYELNVNHEDAHMGPIDEGQDVIIVIGEYMDKDKIDAYFHVSGQIKSS